MRWYEGVARMEFTRREILGAPGAAVLTGGLAAGAAEPAEAAAPPVSADRTRPGSRAPAPGPVEAGFRELLGWMTAQGWGDYLRSTVGLDLAAALQGGDQELMRPLWIAAREGFRDFGGVRAIQPGDPAMSLLYHALASPDVTPVTAGGEPFAASAYPSLAQIDALENYVYARAPLGPDPDDSLELAVFAYEYRHAGKTPHRKHADLVFARTGVARTGTHPSHWHAPSRSHVTRPEGEAGPDSVAVLPARYGLFLARRIRGGAVHRIGHNSRDGRLDFLLPVRKLYDGCPHLHGHRLAFAESHRDEKLHRLMDFVDSPAGTRFEVDAPPFIRQCASLARPGEVATLRGHDTPLAGIAAMAGSAVVTPEPQPLVCEAFQGPQRLRFIVPAEKESHLGLTSNRRYTTLKLLEQPFMEVIDFVLSDFVFGGGRHTTGLRSPRNGPVFVNIRHEVIEGGQIRHIGNSRAELERIERGGYEAAMFVDGLCDGCVEAQLEPPATSAVLPLWLRERPRPAFSLVAAPDFFPRFDPVDLPDEFFLEGGSESASGGRLPANPNIRRPGRPGERAFPPSIVDKAAETVTAVLSAPPQENVAAPPGASRGNAINSLPDTVSNVFAPGWDVTYSRSERLTYYATFGLGSPFPEDMKLCAAANGMWAGSSPDAARTFYPDLEPLPVLGRPATAVPLSDEELGHHPQSPAAREFCVPDRRGWDGEYSPFILVDPASREEPLAVNYADMMISDYVVNARAGYLDLGRMRELSAQDVIERMDALRASIRALTGGDRVRNTRLWLVSMERVEEWADGARAVGLPRALDCRDRRDRLPGPAGARGRGWLYVFAVRGGTRRTDEEAGRRIQPCRRLYICRVIGLNVAHGTVESRAGEPLAVRWN